MGEGISKHVVSLSLSKRLAELGLKQESMFYWIKESDPYVWYNSGFYPASAIGWGFSSWLASELMDRMPAGVCQIDKPPLWGDDSKNYLVFYAGDCIHYKDDRPQIALAKFLIHLIENGLVDEQWRKEWLDE